MSNINIFQPNKHSINLSKREKIEHYAELNSINFEKNHEMVTKIS